MNPQDIIVKPKIHPLLAALPPALKDPKNYEKVKKVIHEALAGSCSHADITDWAGCEKCQERFLNRRMVLKKLGFKNPAQYMAWQKTHEKIKEYQKVIFPKYSK